MSEINISQSPNLSTSYSGDSKDLKVSNKKIVNICSSDPVGNNKPNIPRPNSLGRCMICLQETAEGKFTDCDHQLVCAKCAQAYVLACIQNNQIPTCLLLFCKAPLNPKEMMFRNFSTATHLKWKAFELKSKIKVSRHQSILNCQSVDCPGFIDPNTDICPICEEKHCHKCHRIDHLGQCLGVSTNINGFEGIKNCKFCPARLYKEGGCPKITCHGCRKTICFQCLQQWSISHHGCAQYGWFSFIFNYFSECCSSNTVSRSEMLIERI